MEKKLKRWQKKDKEEALQLNTEQFNTETPGLMRRKIKNRPKISDKEVIEIGFRIIVEYETQKDIAREFRITQARVSQIVNKIQSHPKIIEEMQQLKD